MEKTGKAPPKSIVSRLGEIGSLTASIGMDLAGSKLGGFFDTQIGREKRSLDSLARNAAKLAGTLGNLKGAAMKVGQMLSLYDAFLPKELTEALQSLQSAAPPVAFGEMAGVLAEDIPAYRNWIGDISDEALASASVGQVHRARLKDGREIVIKVQYPGIERAMQSDLKSLRLLISLIATTLPFKADSKALLDEVHTMILTELDYQKEAKNQQAFGSFFQNQEQICIPAIIPELCSPRVIASTYEPGHSLQEMDSFTALEQSTMGIIIFEFLLDQIFFFQQIHSDPNPGNFALRPNGQLVVYDFGSVKKIPPLLVRGYRRLLQAALIDRDPKPIPSILKEMGIHKHDQSPIPVQVIQDWFTIYEQVFYQEYCFGSGNANRLIRQIRELGQRHFLESLDLVFPADLVFIDRTLGGTFGNLAKLETCAHFGNLIQERLALYSRSDI
ncbi:MAG: hypothetical protein KDK39_13675 [Leptospiraceae bacterium]|nr:hypothetical protein [Leptospiraceae bacterium]